MREKNLKLEDLKVSNTLGGVGGGIHKERDEDMSQSWSGCYRH
jgi:hypothetical protein